MGMWVTSIRDDMSLFERPILRCSGIPCKVHLFRRWLAGLLHIDVLGVETKEAGSR